MSQAAAEIRNAKTLREIHEIATRIGSPILREPTTHVLRGLPDALDDVVRIAVDDAEDEAFGAFLRDGDDVLHEFATRAERRRLLQHVRKAMLQVRATVPATPPPPSRGMDAWAEEIGISDLLDAQVRHLVPYAEDEHPGRFLHSGLDTLPVRQVLRAKDGYLVTSGLKAFVERALERAGRLRSAAVHDDAKAIRMLASPVADARVADLFRRLSALRETVRATAEPMPHELLMETRAAFRDERTPQLVVMLPDPHSRRRSIVSVSLGVPRSGPVSARCDACGRPCSHVVGAIDALAYLFSSPSEAAREMLTALAAEPWSRWMSTLDDRIAKLDDARAKNDDAQLWWRLEEDPVRVTPLVSQRGKRGGYLKPKRVSAESFPFGLLKDPRDAAAFALFASGDQRHPAPAGVFAAVSALAGHPRVLVEGEGDEPWEIVEEALAVTVTRDLLGLTVHAAIGARVFDSHEILAWVDEWGLGAVGAIAFDDSSRRVIVTPLDQATYDLLITMDRRAVPVPLEHRDELFKRLNRLARRVDVRPEQTDDLPPANQSVVCLLRPLDQDAGIEIDVRVQPVEGGALFVPGEGPRDVVASVDDGPLAWARRDLDGERRHAADVMARVGEALGGARIVIDDLDRAIDLVAKLRSTDGLECRWPARDWRPAQRASAAQLRFEVSAKNDWFQIAGGLDVDGRRVDLALILEAAREQRRYVRMRDGEFVELESQLAEQLRRIEPLTEVEKNRVSLLPAGADLLSALSETAGAFEAPARFTELAANIAQARRLDPQPPASLREVLRPYQCDGHAWMTRLAAWGAGAVLADDMGLGKTLQAIAVLTDRSEGPQLVVAPTSVCFNWVRELERFAPALDAVLYGGTDRDAKLAALGPGSVLIVSYGLLVRDAEAFESRSWRTLVVDEAQAIKNAATKRWKAVRAIDAAWSVALTGTPVENRAEELWSIFSAVFPGLLGGRERFRRRFAAPMEAGDARASAALAETIRPYVLRRTKREVASELPERTDVVVDVVLSKKERDLYEDARIAAVAELSQETGLPEVERRFRVLAALTRLRQLACHPRLRDPESVVPSAKLTHLMRMLDDLVAEDRRALVFSQFVKHLDLVAEGLASAGIPYVRLDGTTPAAQRGAIVDRFQSGEVPVFLVSLKAGGTGLNLTAADTVVHLDPWWNPAAEDQATDRAHRIGQTRAVTVYRLVSRGTIEEEILAMHADKRKLVEDLLSGSDRAGRMSSEELLAMMRRGIEALDDDDDEIPSTPPAVSEPSPPAELADAFALQLEADVTDGALSRNTAGIYRRIGARALQISGASDLGAWVDAYLAEVDRGRFPKSDGKFVSAALGRLVAFRDAQAKSRS